MVVTTCITSLGQTRNYDYSSMHLNQIMSGSFLYKKLEISSLLLRKTNCIIILTESVKKNPSHYKNLNKILLGLKFDKSLWILTTDKYLCT